MLAAVVVAGPQVLVTQPAGPVILLVVACHRFQSVGPLRKLTGDAPTVAAVRAAHHPWRLVLQVRREAGREQVPWLIDVIVGRNELDAEVFEHIAIDELCGHDHRLQGILAEPVPRSLAESQQRFVLLDAYAAFASKRLRNIGRFTLKEGVRGSSSTKRHPTGMCVAGTCSRRYASSVGFGRLLNAGLELDGGSGYLSEPPVRDADDRRRRDGRMQQQGPLDRLGKQLEAAAHDGTVGATAMKEKSVLIEHRDVGGADPLRPDPRRNHFEQAFLAGRQDRAGLGIDDPQLRSR